MESNFGWREEQTATLFQQTDCLLFENKMNLENYLPHEMRDA